jgi:hypothetical protein
VSEDLIQKIMSRRAEADICKKRLSGDMKCRSHDLKQIYNGSIDES